MTDMINHPAHYGGELNKFEVINIEEHYRFIENHFLASALEYICRARKKGDYLENIGKARWWLRRFISYYGADGRLSPWAWPSGDIEYAVPSEIANAVLGTLPSGSENEDAVRHHLALEQLLEVAVYDNEAQSFYNCLHLLEDILGCAKTEPIEELVEEEDEEADETIQ